METQKRFKLTGRRIIAILMALLMCFTIIVPAGGGGNGLGWVNAQTEDVGNASSGKLVRFTTITLKDVTTGELIVEKGIPTGNRVNENDNVTIMFEFLIGEMDTIEKDENGNYLTFSTEVNTSGGRLKETGSDYLPDTGNSNRDMGDWSLTSDGKLTVNINDKGADSAAEQGNGYVFLKGTGKSIWVTWEGKLDFSGVEDAETGEGMIDVIVAGEKTAVPVNLDDNNISVSKKINQKDGNDVYYDKKSGKYFVDYQINVKTDKGYALINSIEDKAGTTIGDDFYNLQISLKNASGSVSKIDGVTLADLNTAIRTDEELIITYSREVKPDFLNGSDKYYDSDGSRTNKAIVHGRTNHDTKVSPESSPVIYSNSSPAIGKKGEYENGKINWTCYIEIPKDSGISVKTIEDEISHTITPNTATDGNIGAAPSNIKNIANWNQVSDNPIRYEYSYSTDVSELLLEEKNIKAALIKNELNVVFRDQNGEEVTRYIAPVVEVNPGTGESIHTSKATVQKTFEEYNKFKQVSTKYRLLKWEITVTTPSEEDWNDLSYIDLIDDPHTKWLHQYLARRVELQDGTLLYSDSGFNRGQSSNTGYFTDEGKKYFDTSLAEADKTQYPFDIKNGCLKLRLKKDNLSPEKDYTFVVYTRVTDDSKLSTRSFKNTAKVLTTFKDTLTVEEDEDDTAESGVLKTTEKFGEPVGKGGEVEYTVTFDLGAYAKKLHMQNRTLYPNDKIVFYDEIKNGYLEYVPDSAVLSCDMFQNENYRIPYLEFTGNLEVSTDGGKTTFTYTMTDELMKLFDYTTGTFTYHGSQFNPILKINYLAKLTDEEARELTLSEEKENNYSNEVKVSYNGVVVGQDTEDVFLTANKVLDKQYVHQGAKLTYTVTVNPDAVKFNDDGSRLYAKDIAGANLRIIKNSIKVSDENGELEIGSGKNQYDYKIEKDQNGDNVLKFDIPDGKALTITYSALIDVAGNIIQPTDRVANTFYLYKHKDVMEIDRVSKSIESGDFVQDSGGSSARATVRLSKVWFNGQKYVSLSDCKFELYECRVKDGIVLIGDRVSFNRDNNIYMANVDGANTEISIAEEGISVKELDFAKLYLLHETEAPNPLNKTDYYFIVSNDSGNDDSLKITDEQFKEKYLNVTDEDGNSVKINRYKDSNAEFEIEDFVEFELQAKKTVVFDNGNPAPMGTYTFEVNEVDSDSVDAAYIDDGYTASKQNDADGNVDFDPIRITMTSDEEYYYYKVSEDGSSLPTGTTGDDTFYIITMHVKRNDSGEFVHELAYVKYAKDEISGEYIGTPVSADEIKFNNIVESGDAGSIQISKKIKIDGTDKTSLFEDKEYLFTVKDSKNNYYDVDGNKSSDEVTVAVKAGETVTIGGLKPGEYTVVEKESSTPLLEYRYKGLNIDPLLGEVTVVKDEIANVVAVNNYETKTAPVKIIKKDVEDKKLLGGAVFELTGTGLSEAVTKATISATGEVTFDELLYGGTYELKEVKAPDGYALSASSPWTIKVSDSGVVTIQGNGEEHASVYTSAGFVVYNKKAASKLTITKSFSGDVYDSDKEVVHFLVLDEAGKVVKDFHYSEMEDGKMTLDLVPGKYTVIEEPNGREGYTIKTTYSVDSDYEEGIVLKTAYTDDGVKIDLVNDDNMIVSFKNVYSRDTGNIKITKKFVDANNNTIDISSLTEKQKKYIKFIIIGPDDYNGKGFREVSLLDFDNLTYEEKNVPTGEYVIIESWPNGVKVDGYEFDDYVVSKKVNGQTSSEDTIMLGKGDSAEFLFDNIFDTGKGEISITKIIKIDGEDKSDLYSDKAYYFTVKDDLYYYDAAGNKSESEVKIPVKAGEEVKVKNLEPNTYTVAEAEDGTALGDYRFEGVTLSPETGDVVVGAGTTVGVTATNDYVTKTAAIKLIKKDAKDKTTTLGGAKFELTGTGIETTQKITLNANGEVEFDNLLYGGTYELKEVEAPEDYVISKSSPWTVNVASNGVVTIKGADEDSFKTYTSAGYEIFNEKPEAVITVAKTFEGTADDSIKNNVKFLVSDKDGKTVAEFTYADMTDGKKDIAVKPGKYTVSEEAADVSGYTVTRKYSVDSSVDEKDVAEKEYVGDAVSLDVSDKEEVTVAFKNDYVKDTGNLKITKKFINVDDNSSIDISKLTDAEKAKVIFEIEGPDSFDEIITLKDFSSDFTYTFENIPVGEYTITEDNQLTDTKEYTFVDYVVSYKDGESEIEPDFNKVKVTKNSTTESTVTNAYEKKMAVLAVSKTFEGTVSETDKNKVAFEIYDAESKLYAAFTYEDMESGIKTLEVLPGEYTVKEAANDIKGITISKSYKVESSDSDHNASGTYTASGVTVTLANKEKAEVAFNNNYVRDSGKLEITKVFANGDETVDISGLTDEEKASVKFTITGPADYETKTISLLDFDSDMKYQETNVPTGNYKVTETGADGLKISGYTFVSSKVGMKDGTAVPDEGAVLAKDETVSFKVVNKYSRKAYIVVSKAVSGDYTNLTDAEKKNIKFTVKDASENEVASFTLYEMVDSKKTIEVEPDKEYFVVESATDLINYKLSATYERKSDLDSTNNISAVYTIGDKVATNTVHAAETVTVKFTNSYTSKKGSLVIKKNLLLDNEEKKDNTKEFVFNVRNKETGIFYNKVATASEKPQDIKVAAGSTVTIEDLPVGTYEITEVTDKNPEIEGYTYQTTKVGTEEKVVAEVTVKDGLTNDPAEVSFINEYTRDKGYLQIVKSFEDENGKAIDESSVDKSKISFTITGPDGYEKTVAYSEFTDGKYLLANINTGNYSIKETVSDGSVENYTISTNLSTMSKKDVAVTSDTTEIAELKNVYTRDKGKLKIKKSFSFTKIDGSEANPSLTDEIKENIKFTITGPDDYSLVVTYKDFTNGEYEVSGLAAGTYSVKETGYDTEKLIENYSFVTDSSDVAVKSDLNVTATNEPVATFKNVYTEDYGYLNIRKTVKVDSDSDISNADSNIVDKTFKITVKNADGKYVSAEVDTNNNAVLKDNKNDAVISIKNGEDLTLGRLAAGVYTVEEDKDAALAGDSETAGITLKDLYGLDVTGTGEVTVSKENAASGSPAKTEVVNNYLTRKFVKIIKTDLEGNKLSGAKLEILSSDGTTVVDSWTSDKDKDYFITGLEAGKTYILKETVAPNGYKITTDSTFSFDDEGRVTVNGAASLTTEGKIQTILVKDEATKVSISKVDVTNEKELEGATIQILDENGNVVELNGKKAEWVSTNEPHVIEGLDVEKTYTLRETVAPEGYTIATDTKFELNADGTVNKTKTTTKTNSEGVLLIEDKKTSVKISKVDIANGKEVEGATIQILDKDGNVVKVDGERLEWVSTKTPHEIKGLATGKTYTLKEVIAPEGYTIATETEFELNADGTINTSKTTASINDDGVLLVEDDKISVKISKVDVVGGAEIEGATIQILDKDGNVVRVNGKKLEWVSSNKPYIISGLSSGETYTLRETVAPDGYTVATDTTFVLKADGTVDKERTTTKTDSKGVLLVEDKMTSVKISKVDVTNNEELEGATIQILDENGNVVVANGETLEWVSTKTPKEIKGLTVGKTYTLRETAAPAGYKVATDTKFELNLDGTINTVNTTAYTADGVIFVNDSLTSVKISKKDITNGEELEGATIQILDENGKIVTINGEKIEWVSTKEAHEIKGLETKKKYILRETVAPDGYAITTDTYFELNADGTVNQDATTTNTDKGVLLVEDKMTSVKISKVDIAGGEEIEGATIQILDENENIVTINGEKIEWVSTKEAHEIKGLETKKKYILRETIAPDGYSIATDTYFELKADGTVNTDKTTSKITDEESNSLVIEDELTNVYISKRDISGEVILKGAVIQILNADKTVAKDKDGNEIEFTTTEDEFYKISGLTVGKNYYIHEAKAPEGYKLTADVSFYLNKNGQVEFNGSTKEVSGNTVMLLKDAVTELNFTKVGSVNEDCSDNPNETTPLEGVEFTAELLDNDGNVQTGEKAYKAVAVSNNMGTVVFNNLPAGDYIIRETATIDSYKLSDNSYYAHVSDAEDAVFEGLTTDFEGTDKVQNNTVVNNKYKTDIKLQKVSEADPDVKLPGSIYELSKEVEDEEGNKSRVVVAIAKTGIDGVLILKGVFADVEYTLTEVESPNGYYVSKNPIKVSFKVVPDPEDPSKNEVVFDTDSFDSGDGTATIDENGNVTWLEPVTIVRFAKLDEAGNHLSGATLQVVDENGDVVVGPWLSTEEDYEVSGLFDANDDKTYKLVEVSAPKGYEVAAPVEFKVDDKKIGPDENYVITVSMTDKKSNTPGTPHKSDTPETPNDNPGNNPQTGDDSPIIPVAGLMLVSFTGLFIIGKKKRNKRKAN